MKTPRTQLTFARYRITVPRPRTAGALALAWLGAACINVPAVYYNEDDGAGTGGTGSPGVGGSSAGGAKAAGSTGGATTRGSGGTGAAGGERPAADGGRASTSAGGSEMGGMGSEDLLLPPSDRAGCPTPEGVGGSAYEFPPPGCPCHEGPLYTTKVNVNGKTDYFPVECADAPENESVGSMCAAIAGQSLVFGCTDEGAGFTPNGEFVEQRSSRDIPLLRLEHPNDVNTWGGFDGLGYKYHCHAGGTAIGTYECGDVPVEQGKGGVITPGTYALTSLVQYGTPTFRIAGNNFQQTLLVTETSIAVLSDDSAIFIFNGAYLYRTQGPLVQFDTLAATYSEASARYFFPWTETAAYTATEDRLDIYAPAEGYWASFERVP